MAAGGVEAAGADPWSSLASGTVLATFGPDVVDEAVCELRRRGHVAVIVGETKVGQGVTDVSGAMIAWPDRDEVARLLEP